MRPVHLSHLRWQFSLRKLLLWMTVLAGYSTFLGACKLPFEAGCFVTLWLGGLIVVHYFWQREAQFMLSIIASLLVHLLLAFTVAFFIAIELLLRGTAPLFANFAGTVLVVLTCVTIPAAALGIFNGIWGYSVVSVVLDTIDCLGELGDNLSPANDCVSLRAELDRVRSPLAEPDSPQPERLRSAAPP